MIEKQIIMEKFKNILTEVPTEDCDCEIITNEGNTLIVEYSDEFGIFLNELYEFGWRYGGYNSELVLGWRLIKQSNYGKSNIRV